MSRYHSKSFETISKVDNQISNISDEDVDDCNHDIMKGNCFLPYICRGNLGENLLTEYLQVSHTLCMLEAIFFLHCCFVYFYYIF